MCLCVQVFVCCLLGYSRSATIVAAYLMKKKGFTATQVWTRDKGMYKRDVKDTHDGHSSLPPTYVLFRGPLSHPPLSIFILLLSLLDPPHTE